MGGEKIGMKKVMAFSEAADYLADLHKHFKEGKIVIIQGEEHVVMTPPEQVMVEIEAKQKKGKKKFAMEISWAEPEGGDLTITDKEPEKMEEEKKEDKEETAKPADEAKPEAAAKTAAKAADAAAAKAKETATAKKPAGAKPAAGTAKKGPGAK